MSAPTPITHAAIVGGGRMGADIALVTVRGGCRTWVVEASAGRRAALPAHFEHAASDLPRVRESITVVENLDDVPWPAIDLAVECVPEEITAKRAVFAELASHGRRDALIVSNSSSLPISRIAEGQPTADRMLGWHFFYPANLVPLVEVVLGPATIARYAETLVHFSGRCRLVPILVKKDVPGFVANRLQHALAREAYALVDAGVVSREDLDRAVQFGFGFRYLVAGPLRQRDHGGLDVHAAAAAEIYPTLANNAELPAWVRDLVRAEKFGLNTGEGFYPWPAAAAAAERERYERVLRRALKILEEESGGES